MWVWKGVWPQGVQVVWPMMFIFIQNPLQNCCPVKPSKFVAVTIIIGHIA